MARNNSPIITSSITPEIELIAGGQAIVTFAAASGKRDITASGVITSDVGGEEMVYWGPTNTAPDNRELLLSCNNIVPQLLRTMRNILLGKGLMAVKERFENGEIILDQVEMPGEISDWLEENEIEHTYLPCAIKNLLAHGNIYSEFEPLKGGGWNLTAIESRYVRAKKQNTKGKIPGYFLYGNWGRFTRSKDKQKTEKTPTKIPAFTKETFQQSKKCLLHSFDSLVGGPYYYQPYWEGAMRWIEVANNIPEFHFHNLRNGYSIRYHIKIPANYFALSLPEELRKASETLNPDKLHEKAKEEMTLRTQFVEKMNKFFAGVENNNRAMVSTKFKEKFGTASDTSEIEIEPLDSNLQDEAMLKLYESSNTAIVSAFGVPPILASIATGAKMTSGNEARNLFNFFQETMTRHSRKTLLKPINIILKDQLKKHNIKLAFVDVKLETTDKNPNGITENPQE